MHTSLHAHVHVCGAVVWLHSVTYVRVCACLYSKFCSEKRRIFELRVAQQRAAARRLRQGLVRRIQKAYRRHLFDKWQAAWEEEQDAQQDATVRQLFFERGVVLPPAFANLSDEVEYAATIIQCAYRRMSARHFLHRAQRAAAVQRAKELLIEMGYALASTDDADVVCACTLWHLCHSLVHF